MKLKELYTTVKSILLKNNVDSASFETELLLNHFCNVDRKMILSGEDFEIHSTGKVLSALEKRVNGTPLQYILGKWEFYGRDFYVGDGVLIPRPDTEILVEETLKILTPNMTVADLCSGSGCIAITLEQEIKNLNVYALEKSKLAYSYLQKNITLNNSLVTPILCDVLDYNFSKPLDVIVSNPPYIKAKDIPTLSKEVQNEPQMALDGGEDGLFFYREIVSKWKDKIKSGGTILFEIGYDQAHAVSEILAQNGFKNITVVKDYSQNDRVIKATK